jgi:hypothetical protein
MSSKAFALALLSTLAAAALGCGGGLSTEQATVRCDQERTAQAGCFTDEVYASCLNCYEECGDSCTILESCPLQYSCQ